MNTDWNFGRSRYKPLSLDQFLAGKEAAGFKFFAGQEPWMQAINKLSWQTFFRVCTQEMDDLSEKAVKHVIEYTARPMSLSPSMAMCEGDCAASWLPGN
jgi:hypothetical protein